MNRHTRHERKCWDCGNVAEHYDNCTPEVNCKHDYGVMDEDARESLRQSASEWYRCWKSAGVIR